VAAAEMTVLTQSPNNNWAKFGDFLMKKKVSFPEKMVLV